MTNAYPSGWSVEPVATDELQIVGAMLTDRCRWLAQRRVTQWPATGFPPEVLQAGVNAGEIYLARVRKAPVGTFALTDESPSWRAHPGSALYVQRLATQVSWGGRQVGATMLDWIGERANDEGRSYVRLDVPENDALVKYFTDLGFNEVGRSPSTRTPAILMERPAHK